MNRYKYPIERNGIKTTYSHLQPAMPERPSSVFVKLACMAETNMAEAGYEALKMAIRAATSRGVLHDRER
jgi:hypothetical protein